MKTKNYQTFLSKIALKQGVFTQTFLSVYTDTALYRLMTTKAGEMMK